MTSHILGQISAEQFLSDYWQKKPLVISGAIPGFQSPVSADELAGLSLEADVESRIILEHGATPWELKHGPFTEQTFANLPETHWTLLVQAVDHWVPEVRELLNRFRFLPSWRLDDIMISYATDGGNVGAHYDQYDVFLLQAEGKRRWQIGSVYNEHSPTLNNTPLHILSEFETQQEYVLEPGDMLYLPPGVGHHGVAEGDCITISIGFRAPSHRDILMQFTDFVADQLPESHRYSDAGQRLPSHPAEVDEEALDRLHSILRHYIDDRALLGQWFGEMTTQPKYEPPETTELSDWTELMESGDEMDLYVSSAARLAFRREDHCFYLFANGQRLHCESQQSQQLALSLCTDDKVCFQQWSRLTNGASQQLLIRLINLGVLELTE